MLPVIVQVPPDRTRMPGTEHTPDPVELFAEWMSLALGAPVPVLRKFLPDAPTDAFLIAYNYHLGEKMDACSPEQRLQISRRSVMLAPACADPAGYFEQLQLAAAMELSMRG